MKIKINLLNKIEFIILFLILCIIFISLFIIKNLFLVIFSYVLMLFLIMLFKINNDKRYEEINNKNIFGFKEIVFDEMFDLNGESAIIKLQEHIDLETRVSHYIAVLIMIGRDKLKFLQEEVDEKELKTVNFEDWNRFR